MSRSEGDPPHAQGNFTQIPTCEQGEEPTAFAFFLLGSNGVGERASRDCGRFMPVILFETTFHAARFTRNTSDRTCLVASAVRGLTRDSRCAFRDRVRWVTVQSLVNDEARYPIDRKPCRRTLRCLCLGGSGFAVSWTLDKKTRGRGLWGDGDHGVGHGYHGIEAILRDEIRGRRVKDGPWASDRDTGIEEGEDDLLVLSG